MATWRAFARLHGTVAAFDASVGLGEVRADDGEGYRSTATADRRRHPHDRGRGTRSTSPSRPAGLGCLGGGRPGARWDRIACRRARTRSARRPGGEPSPSIAALTCTKASRIWASASRSVAPSGPSRSPTASTSAAVGLDGHLGLGEVRLLGAEVDRGELVEPHGVVGDDDRGRNREQLAAHLGHLGGQGLGVGAVLGVERPAPMSGPAGRVRSVGRLWRRSAIGGQGSPLLALWRPEAHRRLVGCRRCGHDCYPNDLTTQESGARPHPATSASSGTCAGSIARSPTTSWTGRPSAFPAPGSCAAVGVVRPPAVSTGEKCIDVE